MHRESHLVQRIGWLRAAVLGANDGIVSTASLIVGVAAAAATRSEVLIAGVAGLVAGAMSMAAGEYVSVSSQSDTEKADLARERKELSEQIELEREELAHIYVERGVDLDLARQVASQLMEKDALTAHARDELGISEIASARPVQAALDVGRNLCRWSRAAAPHRRDRAARRDHSHRLGRVFRVPGAAWRSRRESRRRRRPARRGSRDVLGRIGAGADGGRRQDIRHWPFKRTGDRGNGSIWRMQEADCEWSSR